MLFLVSRQGRVPSNRGCAPELLLTAHSIGERVMIQWAWGRGGAIYYQDSQGAIQCHARLSLALLTLKNTLSGGK
jgi:hypothetical protein